MKQIHANLVEFRGCGILITGDHATGKTRLTFELVERGASFIADDSVVLFDTPAGVEGSAPDATRGLIAFEGAVRPATDVFGKHRIADRVRVTKHIDLDSLTISDYGR